MLKKVIEYEDFNGNMRKVNAYFHLGEAELLKFLVMDGEYTLREKVIRLFEQRNAKEIMSTFEELIDASYGEQSLDGSQFIKSPEILAKFKQSPAYDVLFLELVTDASKAADFFNGIVPKKISDRMKEIIGDEDSDVIPEEMRDLLTKNESAGAETESK